MEKSGSAAAAVAAALMLVVASRPAARLQPQPVELPEAPALTCSPDRPVVLPGQSVTVTAWSASAGPGRTFEWNVTGGTIQPTNNTATWTFTNVKPGAYAADVRLVPGAESCRIRVILGFVKSRGVGRAFLVGTETEPAGYALYSYLVLPARPSANAQARYDSALRAFLDAIVDVNELANYLDTADLNITFVPVSESFPEAALPDPLAWLLKSYNYPRASSMLNRISGVTSSPGPFLVSCTVPIARCATDMLVQDLAHVPPPLVRLWMREFLNHAAQQDLRASGNVISLGLRMRTTLAVLATATGPVLDSLVKLVKIGK